MSDIQPPQPNRFTGSVAAVLFYAIAIMLVAQSCLFTILPPIGRQIGLSEFQIGMLMSIHGAFMLVAGPWWGSFSETAGRRRVIMIGTTLYTISILMFGLVIDAALRGAVTSVVAMWLLIGSRSLFAIGAGAVTPAAMAMAADLSSRENRLKAMSLLSSAMSIGAIMGPSASALFSGLGLAAPFYIIAFMGVTGLIISSAMLPVTRPQIHTSTPSFRNLLRGRVLAIAVSSWFFMCGNFGIYAILGFYVQDHFQLGAIEATRWMGIALMATSGVSVLSQSLIIRRLKVGPLRMIMFGAPLCIIAFGLIWTSTDLLGLVLAMSLNGFGQSFVNPAITTSLSLSVGSSGQGRLAGLSTSMQALSFLIGPVSGAVMYSFVPILPFIMGSIFIVCAMALTVAIHSRAHPESQ